MLPTGGQIIFDAAQNQVRPQQPTGCQKGLPIGAGCQVVDELRRKKQTDVGDPGPQHGVQKPLRQDRGVHATDETEKTKRCPIVLTK